MSEYGKEREEKLLEAMRLEVKRRQMKADYERNPRDFWEVVYLVEARRVVEDCNRWQWLAVLSGNKALVYWLGSLRRRILDVNRHTKACDLCKVIMGGAKLTCDEAAGQSRRLRKVMGIVHALAGEPVDELRRLCFGCSPST